MRIEGEKFEDRFEEKRILRRKIKKNSPENRRPPYRLFDEEMI